MNRLYRMHMVHLARELLLLGIPGPLGSQVEQAGGFVTRRGGQEVARERYRFDGRSLRAEQVALADAELLRTAAPRGELAVLAGANHLFKAADLAGRVGELALEADPRVPIMKELVERTAAWAYALNTAPFR